MTASKSTLAVQLNACRTFASSRGWQVARVLANPIYAGTLVYGRQVRVRGKKPRSDRPHLVLPGAAGPLVDQETWAAAQEAGAGRKAVRRAPGSAEVRCELTWVRAG